MSKRRKRDRERDQDQDRDSDAPARPGIPLWAKVLIGIGAVLLGLRACSSLAVNGTQSYLNEAKTSEAKSTLGAIARGMVACMADRPATELVVEPTAASTELPPSASAVPWVLPKGKPYQTTASEWSAPAFQCAKFSLSTPQYFQYEWERVSPTQGVIHARGDLDGDGKVDTELSQEIKCSGPRTCTAGALVAK